MNAKLRTVIVDDEQAAIEVMDVLLRRYCPNVQIEGATTNSLQAVSLMNQLKPDLLMLDVEMPHLNGFQLLEKLTDLDFQVVFTTAYDQFAVKAFKASAVDYLLKPVSPDELMAAVAKAGLRPSMRSERLAALKGNLAQRPSLGGPLQQVALPSAKGFVFQRIGDIIYCEANNSYTKIYLEAQPPLTVSKTLAEIEAMLDGGSFFRIHRQYLVNMTKLKELQRTDGGLVVLSSGDKLPVARNRKDDLMEYLGI